MNQTPRKQAESGLFAEVWKEYNRLLDYIKEISPKSGFGIRTSRTINGTVVAVDKSKITEAETVVQWKGEWRNQVYQKNDIVIRGSGNQSSAGWNNTDAILEAGVVAGVYIAIEDVPLDSTPPSEPNLAGSKWETLARFATHIHAIKKPGEAGIIRFDGRSSNGNINVRLQDCNGKDLTVREVAVCVGGVEKKMMVIGSEAY